MENGGATGNLETLQAYQNMNKYLSAFIEHVSWLTIFFILHFWYLECKTLDHYGLCFGFCQMS